MNIGFIGAGNMGSALARSISKVSETKIYIYDISNEKACNLASEIGARSVNFDDVVLISDILFLGVKPNVLPEVCQRIGKISKSDMIIVSMAAGATISSIENALSRKLPIIRIMPNTPVLVGEGFTAYAKNELVTDGKLSDFLSAMQYTGTLEALSEEEIDSFCAIAGCGPAYAYIFIDALAKGAEKCGISRENAIRYAALTARGATRMTLDTNTDPATLCKNVCSPGGATIEGVKVLEARGFEDSVLTAVEAAFKRTKELGK